MKLLITGSAGYIGSRLVEHASYHNHQVIAASRNKFYKALDWVYFDIFHFREFNIPTGVDVIIYLAAVFDKKNNELEEVLAAKHLIQVAKRTGAKFIFVSSQTARMTAPTAYGRSKWLIEREVLAAGGWVVRPGQVYGGPERGLFGVLVNTVRRLPVIPAFFPSPMIQPIHVDDLVAALLKLAESNNIPSSVLCIGAAESVSFTNFLQSIAKIRLRRCRLIIPVPIFLVRLLVVAMGRRLRAELGLDRLTSLFDLPAMEVERDLRLLGVSLRSLSSGMALSGNNRRRSLIREGQALLAYVLKARPTPVLIRRYVRSIEIMKGGLPLHLPEFVLRWPMAIALLDDAATLSTSSGANFVWRLNAAVVLAEASVQGARRFLAIGDTSGFITSLIHMTFVVAVELWWRILRLVAAPLLRPVLRHSGLSNER